MSTTQLPGLAVIVGGVLLCVGSQLPAVSEVCIAVGLQSATTTYYANTAMLFGFSLVNCGSEEVRFSFHDPFRWPHGGFYMEVSPAGRSDYQSYSSGWHEVRGIVVKPQPRGPRLRSGEQLLWRNYMPKTSGVHRYGLEPGLYSVRARFVEPLYNLDITSPELEIHILPPPPGEEQAREDFAKYTPGLMERLNRWPDSVYTPHFLSYLAWLGEGFAAAVDLPPDSPWLTNALECRRRLREKYPDWMYNDEGLYREAAVRVKIGEPEKAVELLESLVRDYPDSPVTPKAKAILPEIRELVVKPVKHDHGLGTMTIQKKVELFNLNGPERSRVE